MQQSTRRKPITRALPAVALVAFLLALPVALVAAGWLAESFGFALIVALIVLVPLLILVPVFAMCEEEHDLPWHRRT